jgi:NitT/TauT family transport system substrate-binding protein
MSRPLRVVTAFPAPFYAPVNAAVRLGAFADEGLDVHLWSPAPGQTPGMLLRGEADVAVSGVMRCHVLADQSPPVSLLTIAEVNSRDGFYLLTRRPADGFRWDDLAGKRLALFTEAPTPWMCLQDVLRRHGVAPGSVAIRSGLPGPLAVEALLAGEVDFLQTGQPTAEQLLVDGNAHLAAAMADTVGPLPYSSFLVSPAFRQRESDLCARAVRGLARAQRWMVNSRPADIASLIAPDFPDIARPVLTRVVDRFQSAGTWPAHPHQPRAPYERMGQILVDGGLVGRAARFEDVCDNSFADSIPGPAS